ncbi:hypothetical protein [uncultured Oscillibacter sp.]|uniref:hypothetical protein n=1 Tax=uncultured Oscillibacter sp. TaxID=876091 RepID=UPI0025E47FC2|nr:hypothetical protein [uncultured Oscillibacter sp.]
MSQVLTWLIFYTLSRKVTSISFYTLFKLVERFEAVEFIVYLTNDPNHLGILWINTQVFLGVLITDYFKEIWGWMEG